MSEYFQIAESQKLPSQFAWGRRWREGNLMGYTILYFKEAPTLSVKAIVRWDLNPLSARDFKVAFKKHISKG